MNKEKKIGISVGLLLLGIIVAVYSLADLDKNTLENEMITPSNSEFTEPITERSESKLETVPKGETVDLTADKLFFNFEGVEGENYVMLEDGRPNWISPILTLKEEHQEFFDEIMLTDIDQKTAFIIPDFTYSAYENPGFYNYYKNQCNEKCLTTQIESGCISEASCTGTQALNLLGYHPLSDVEVDQNPEILKQYDRIIVLHNEYVTQKEFDALNNHPKVIYLYPNALYGKVSVDYEENTITLIRGHGYPESNIINGFDWEYENTPFEFDKACNEWDFYEIDNGYMLNCYPEVLFLHDKTFLSMIKDL